MNASAADNELSSCRICQLLLSSSCRPHIRYPSVNATLLMLPVMLMLMMLCFCNHIAAAHQSDTVAMVANEAVLWTSLSESVDKGAASLSSPVVSHRRPPVNVGRLASLPRRDATSGAGILDRRALIAVHRALGPVGLGPGRAEVVNKARPPPATVSSAAGRPSVVGPKPPAAADSVNATPVITAPRGHYDRPPRIQIRSTIPPGPSSFIAVFHAQQTDDSYLPTTASSSLNTDITSANNFEQLSDDLLQSKNRKHGDGLTASNSSADNIHTFSHIFNKNRDLKTSLDRKRRDSEAEMHHKTPRSGTESLMNSTTATTPDGISTESAVAQLAPDAAESLDMPVALGYRSRGNFAALVDPLKSGRASASAGSFSEKRWSHLSTASDNSTSSSPAITEETTSSPYNVLFESDSIEIKVQKTDGNASSGAANSTSAASEAFNDSRETPNSTIANSLGRNCSSVVNADGLLQTALKSRLPASAVTVCIYTLSFLFTLVAASAITSIILSLCIRNQHLLSSSTLTDTRWSSQLVLGLVAIAAATRALYYIDAEYRLMTDVAPPGGRRAIYESWFPFLFAALFAHQRLLYGEAATKDRDLTSSEGDQHIKRSRHIIFCCESCVVMLVLLCYLTFVVSLCFLIEFCVIPAKTVFVLRLVFALFAVFLLATNIHGIVTSSGRHVSTQVVLCALFVICVGCSCVDAATLWLDDFALLFQQNADVVIAFEAAKKLSELSISIVLCVHSSTTFFRFQSQEGKKSVNVGRKNELGTKAGEKKVASCRQSSAVPVSLPLTRKSWLNKLIECSSKKSKVIDVGLVAPQMSLDVIHTVGWQSTEDCANKDGISPLPPPSRVKRSRSMLYNDHGFIRFRLDGDTDGESDARTLDGDDGGPGQMRSVPVSEYASADDLSSRRGPSSVGTPRWSRPGSPSLAGFRAPSIHLQDSIDRALDRCDFWRVGHEQGQLSVDELRRIVQLYADFSDSRRANHQRRTTINFAEV